MKYVLDSCVAVKWVSPEADSHLAIAIRDGGHDLLAPDIFRYEIGNVLTKAVRRRKMTSEEAMKGLALIEDDLPSLADSHALFPRATEISLDAQCSIWDAFYIALAEKERCEFLTADEKLANNVQKQFSFLTLLSTLQS